MDQHSRPAGTLVLHGGGATTAAFRRRVLELAGGPAARVLAVPQATTRVEIWSTLCALWREAGARQVELLDLARGGEQVAGADLVWITSGDQNRLLAALRDTGVIEALSERYRRGATVGGTSAGAAAISAVMITGEESDPATGATHTAAGLGLWPEVIVDQHVFSRDRVGRLRRAVRDRPALVGVGIDEETYVVVEGGRRFQVEGESAVVVVDARRGSEPVLTTLPAGSRYDLDGGAPGRPSPGL